MSAKPEVQEPTSHRLVRTWTTASLVCGGCGLGWEQPEYEAGAHFVCPRCMHATVPKAGEA